jgi:surfactin synthase thioesterase subunit
MSSCNEEATDDHIEDLGKRLAEEIKLFISKKEIKDFKLSFLGHSLGGVVVRAALPYLESYRGCMHSFLTIGSPHLGYLYHNSVIIKTGMWFMNQMH